jgi:hypothetical protein
MSRDACSRHWLKVKCRAGRGVRTHGRHIPVIAIWLRIYTNNCKRVGIFGIARCSLQPTTATASNHS